MSSERLESHIDDVRANHAGGWRRHIMQGRRRHRRHAASARRTYQQRAAELADAGESCIVVFSRRCRIKLWPPRTYQSINLRHYAAIAGH